MENDSLVGKTFDGFHILSLIGAGGMGATYKALQVEVNRVVALKHLHKRPQGTTIPERWFYREAEIQATLENNPHFVNIYRKFENQHGHFIAMEFVEGQTVKDLLRRGPLDWKTALPLIEQTLKAITDIHTRAIIHRDIKPGNIMLTPKGAVKIIDFGLAKRVEVDGEDTMLAVASSFYSPPEQHQGLPYVDYQSDVYSLGATFYKMLSGSFSLKQNGEIDRSDTSLRERSVPPGLIRIILKAFQLEKPNRYLTAGEMLSDLEAFKEEQPPEQAMSDESKTLPIDDSGQPPSKPDREGRPSKSTRIPDWLRKPGEIITIVGIVLTFIGIIVGIMTIVPFFTDPPPPPPIDTTMVAPDSIPPEPLPPVEQAEAGAAEDSVSDRNAYPDPENVATEVTVPPDTSVVEPDSLLPDSQEDPASTLYYEVVVVLDSDLDGASILVDNKKPKTLGETPLFVTIEVPKKSGMHRLTVKNDRFDCSRELWITQDTSIAFNPEDPSHCTYIKNQ